jgi:hypothetical protein
MATKSSVNLIHGLEQKGERKTTKTGVKIKRHYVVVDLRALSMAISNSDFGKLSL